MIGAIRGALAICAVATICADIAGAESGGASDKAPLKAMLGYDAQHTGFVPRPGPLTEPEILFQTPTGFDRAIFDMAPSMDGDGGLYSDIGSSWRAPEEGRTGGVIAFDAEGKERWRRTFPHNKYGLSVPALTGTGRVVMGFRDGVVRAFQRADGTVAWEFATGSAIIAAPLVDPSGDIYISTMGEGGIYKLRDETGALAWRLPKTAGSGGSPALSRDGRTVYAGWAEQDPGLYALDAATGSVKWKWVPEGEFYFDWCSPVVGLDGTIYQQNERDGTLFALKDGGDSAALLWSHTPDGEIRDASRHVAIDGTAIFIGATGNNPRFTALSLEGEVLWRHEIPGKAEVANIVVNDQAIYFPVVVPDGGAGWLHALDKKDGRQLWRKKITHDDSDVGGVTLGENGVLYAGTSGTVEHPFQAVLVALK